VVLDYLFGAARPPGLAIRLFVDLLYVVSKFSLMGGDVEGLRCHVQWPMNYSCHSRVQSLLTGVVLSRGTI
jgi:hypothetical protein